jgi:hypothetical protein
MGFFLPSREEVQLDKIRRESRKTNKLLEAQLTPAQRVRLANRNGEALPGKIAAGVFTFMILVWLSTGFSKGALIFDGVLLAIILLLVLVIFISIRITDNKINRPE